MLKVILVDIPSGTIIDSGATSPTFEQQVQQQHEPPNFVSKLTDNLFSLLATNDDAKSEGQSELSSWSQPNTNELAVVEWTHWNEPLADSGVGDEISVRFSSLNIVATPPSLAVLLRLLYRLQPKSERPTENVEVVKFEEKSSKNVSVAKIEVNTVNVMIAQVDQEGVGKKIATASIEALQSTTHFQPSGDVCLEGKIGAIHMLDLTGTQFADRSNRIFALGESREPDLDFATIFSRQGRGLDAFNFTLTRRN